MDTSKEGFLKACGSMDWTQVHLHQGEPCFKVEHDRKFCGRAKRWAGHADGGDHSFVSLKDAVSYWLR